MRKLYILLFTTLIANSAFSNEINPLTSEDKTLFSPGVFPQKQISNEKSPASTKTESSSFNQRIYEIERPLRIINRIGMGAMVVGGVLLFCDYMDWPNRTHLSKGYDQAQLWGNKAIDYRHTCATHLMSTGFTICCNLFLHKLYNKAEQYWKQRAKAQKKEAKNIVPAQ